MNPNTPPDIRSVLKRYSLAVQGLHSGVKPFDDSVEASRYQVEALQAISAVVLGCMPDRMPARAGIDYHTDGQAGIIVGFNMGIDRYTDNLRAVLGGTKENT